MTFVIGSGGGGGGKGGGGGSRTPHEERDNLDSKQFARVLDLIGEGEMHGLVDGAKSIFLNNTPLQSADGSFNFKDVSWETRTGTASQTVIPITENTSTVKPTGLGIIVKETPGVVSISDSDVDAVKLTISVPSLQRITDEGDVYGTEIELKISVQYNGGAYSDVVSGVQGRITGRTGDLYQRDYLVALSGSFPVNIKVTRVTDNSASTKLTNAFQWNSYTEIKYDQRPYNDTALVGIRLDAEQFSQIPTRKYRVKGMKCQIPHNGTVRSDGSISYSGVFNGTLGAAVWTSDPAWCLYSLLTSERFGLGDHLDVYKIDKFAFYSASQYASELVDDGTGTGNTEPRFSCNVNIQSRKEAYNVVNQMCSIFRAMPYWSAGALTINHDGPKDASYVFTGANVLSPGFTYSNASQKTRSTVAVVKYLDLELMDVNYEEVRDSANEARYGAVVRNIDAFACTSQGQAHRLGKWLLYMENLEREIVSFTTSLDAGVLVRPGDIIEIADEVRAGERRGGRIKSGATTTAVTVDDIGDITYIAGSTLSVVLPDGSFETKTISGIDSGGVINVVGNAFSAAPNENTIWVYQTSNIVTSTWRVLAIEEQDGINYAITAVEYNSGKYQFVENNVALTERDVTDLNVPPPAPTGLVGTEIMYENTGIARVKIQLSWTTSTDSARIRWRYEQGNWETRSVEGTKGYDILDTVQGDYTIEVYSVSASGLVSTLSATLNPFVAQGKTALPAQVTGVSLLPIDEASAILSWDRSTELDVLLGGRTLIRHSELTSNATWASSQEIVVAATGSQTQKQVPLLTGTYLLRFMDDGGRQSAEPSTTNDLDKTRVEIDLPAPTERLLLQTVDEHTGNFAGSKTNTAYDSGLDALRLTESSGVVTASGEYAFNTVVDLTQPYDVNIKRNIRSSSYYLGSNWDSRTDLIDDWGTIDSVGGAVADQCNAALYLRATDDDPASGSATWGTWREFSNVLVKGRGFQFKILLSSADTNQNISITQLGATLELQGRTESISTPVTTGSSQYTVTFTNAFKNTPNVVITQTNQQSGDFYELANISRTGFQVTFKNGSSAVARSFVWAASGFGKERT